jgi:molecular chaperone DnaK (HSP70)
VYDAKRVIGRAWADPVVREEADAMPFRVVKRRGNGDDLDDLDDGVAFALTDEDDDDEFLEDVFAIVSPEEVSARVLRHLKRAAEASMSRARRALGFKFASATISVPVEFGAAQRAATIRAAERAGFASTRLIEEPVAAAIAHGLDARYNNNNASSSDVTSSSGDSRLVVVYDLGGGTLDVAVLRLDPETRTFLVMGTAGDPRLGGEDFDRALLTLVEGRLSRISIASSGAGMRERAMREVERAKRFCGGGCGAGPAPATSVSLLLDDDASGSSSGGGDDHLLCEDVVLSGDDITLASEALLSRATTPVRDALRRAGEVSPAEVDDVVLVGGGTRLLAVRERLGEVFEGRELRDGVDPALAIAIGAARSYAC